MAPDGAEVGGQSSQSGTPTDARPLHFDKAVEVDLKHLAEQETCHQPGPHDPTLSQPTLNYVTNEGAPEEYPIDEQNGENPAAVKEENQRNDAPQDEMRPGHTTLTQAVDDVAHKLDGPQATIHLEDELTNDVYRGWKALKKPLSERRPMGKRRVVQTMSYIQLVEDRLLYLEAKMNEISQDIKLLSGEDPEETKKSMKNGKARTGRQLILEVNRISVAQDQARKKIVLQEIEDLRSRATKNELESIKPATYEGKLWTGHIIDVVVPDTGPESGLNTSLSLSANVKHDIADPAGLELTEGRRQTPSRVRIHSTLLLKLLEHITEHQFLKSEQAGESHQTFLQPFKLFVTYETAIRKWARKLEEKHEYGSLTSESYDEKEDMITKKAKEAQHLDEQKNHTTGNPAMDAPKPTSGDAPKEDSAADDQVKALLTRECLDQLRVLIQLFDTDLKPVFDDRRDAESGKLGSIAFADLWHIFGSGEEIQSAQGHPQVYRVLTSTGGRPFLCGRREAGMSGEEEDSNMTMYRSAGSPFVIQAFSYDFNGSSIGTVERMFTIQRYEGRRLITSLSCYPIKFAKGATGLTQYRQQLVDRGRRFVQLATDDKKIHYRYSGLTLDEVSQAKEQINSDIIVDFTMAFLKNKDWEPKSGVGTQLQPDRRETKEIIDSVDTEGVGINETVHKDYEIDSQRLKRFLEEKRPNLESFVSVQDLKPDDFLLCPNRVFGFVLRSRKWASFAVTNVEDIIHQETGFDQLVLPEGHRETLLALVETHAQAVKPSQDNVSHTSKSTDELDLVRGKGKGIIILLHGEPGVGKTSTAESVAAYTNRPLFAVTCGDIGQTAEDVESRLETNFQLAHRWGCVLLLDEADVFLDRRSKQDIQRNAIVSVFLRVLEYYSGILFLTTNRIGTFDPAFRSRIHMSLYYPRLDEASTRKVWEVNMDRSKALWQEKIQFKEKNVAEILRYAIEHYKELKKSKTTWNGRQIRNAFQTAIAIAEYDAHRTAEKFELSEVPKACLEKSHFEKVARASSHFDQYLKETWGGTERDLARDGLERREELADSDVNERSARRKRKSGRRRRGSDDYENPKDDGRRQDDGSD